MIQRCLVACALRCWPRRLVVLVDTRWIQLLRLQHLRQARLILRSVHQSFSHHQNSFLVEFFRLQQRPMNCPRCWYFLRLLALYDLHQTLQHPPRRFQQLRPIREQDRQNNQHFVCILSPHVPRRILHLLSDESRDHLSVRFPHWAHVRSTLRNPLLRLLMSAEFLLYQLLELPPL
uniref:(northern house mosquito) hypothetical protein n=1 Tax=Culex pipiens TaxID=7175 RepID=A0A8D8B476_CULPI